MTCPRIYPLSRVVANQIAAGEVIERPASVVKELLENARDARALVIDVEIGFGGLNQIKVSDNGQGIEASDLPLAIAPHATSKIIHLDDLYSLTSLGFRGEALASISSVSRVQIISKPENQQHAMMLEAVAGEVIHITPSARAHGTTVEVLDLFYNAPVRKKFLKSSQSEFLAIEMVVKRFALSAPEVQLTLKHDGKLVLSLLPAHCERTRLMRVKKVLGKSFVDESIALDVLSDDMRLVGLVSAPSYQRSQNDKQWIYVNQRMCKDKLLHHALKFAYGSLLHPGRHPACLLYFTVPAHQVDVNVHPTKHEVRFQQAQKVHDFIARAITEAIATSETPVSSMMKEFAPPSLTTYRKDDIEDFQWVNLNERFSWVFFKGQSFLLDVLKVYRQWLLNELLVAEYPLKSRPLLVPVRHMILKAHHEKIERHQSALMTLGISLDFLSETEVVIRTLPILLSQLDFKAFFSQISQKELHNTHEWCQVLVSCQSINVFQMSLDEKMNLMKTVTPQSTLGCMRFDLETCLALFGEQ